ncbi:hypothetical protein SLS62_007594 [Diatrype stigma]|uniref:Glutamine amidotransferase domain-containing protein n=1 Tax=Diatrype stigma TaxID=117547 RepID=A0AAN9YQM4_9PEZI
MGSCGTPPPVRLAILETDTPVPSILARYGGYGYVFKHLFNRASITPQLEVTSYDVVSDNASYPDPKDIDAILITGSKASAFEDKVWINRLVQYTKDLLNGDDVKKVIGICFGHQIVGRALDAEVAPNPGGWEVSVVNVELTDKGKEVFGLQTMRIHQMHRDAVLAIPAGVENLAQTSLCSTQAFYKPGRLITVQGHPEFTDDMVSDILKIRRDGDIISQELFASGERRVKDKHDGVEIAKVFMRFLRE